jgi:hypothetical protein
MTSLEITIIGLILSAILAGWKIYETLRDKARITVSASFLRSINPQTESSQKMVRLSIVNRGRRPLTITGAAYKVFVPKSLVDKKAEVNFWPIHESFPFELGEGQIKTLDLGRNGLDWSKIEYGWAKDSRGKIYRTKKWPLKESV